MKDRLASVPVIGTALAVQRRYVEDAGDPLAAAIAFFGFLSLFPLLLLAVSVTGFVLDDPADQLAVAETITGAIPGFDQTVEGDDSQVSQLLAAVVRQRGTIGLVGFVTLLFTGLRVVNAAMAATRVVFRGALLTGVKAKLRQLLALVGLGLLALAGASASSIAGIGLGQLPGGVAVLVSLLVTFALDVGLFLGAYTLLSPPVALRVRDRVPGALLAAAGWTGLKVAGATWVGNQIDSANALYGALGSVIALLLLFYLAGRLYLYGGVLSAVRYEAVHGPLLAPHEAELLGLEDEGTAAVLEDTAAAADARDADGPPPVPRAALVTTPADPGPGVAARTVSPPTRARLEAASSRGEREPGRDARSAAAFVLAVGALVAGWRLLGGSQR
ncbi:MAG: YihY/virulence factor BrkB family protein [Nitriliruptoraceae bacterium]